MTSGNITGAEAWRARSTSGNTDRPVGEAEHPIGEAGHPVGAAAVRPVLPLEFAAALAGYDRALRAAPLAEASRRKYLARVRGYLTWLADIAAGALELDPDPLQDPAARDGAVRDWRAWAKTVARHRPSTINNTLAAVDDFYTRRGLGPAIARREPLPRRDPKALGEREVVRYLRAVERCGSARDTVVALLPFYAGLRISEVVGLDVDDVALSARKGLLQVRGKGRYGGKLRELPLTRPELRTALDTWLAERGTWRGADTTTALLLNRRDGARLTDRAARTIITDLGEQVGLTEPAVDGGRAGGFGPHTLRHTFATQLIRAGTDPILVADLLGHASLDTLAVYTQPTDDDRERALAILTTDS